MRIHTTDSALEILLLQDGIRVPWGGGDRKPIRCFNLRCSGSMIVNVANDSYRCDVCGIGGDLLKYLTSIRKLEYLDALRALSKATGPLAYADAERAAFWKRFWMQCERRSVECPYDEVLVRKRLPGRLKALYDYTDEAGKLVFKVGRYEARRAGRDKPLKTFRTFKPKADGKGYWAGDPLRDDLPPEERIRAYPIYRLPAIAEAVRSRSRQPDAKEPQIWVVGGEESADRVARLTSPAGFSPLVCSLYGCNRPDPDPDDPDLCGVDLHDLSILYGQKVLLIAGTADRSRRYMRRLGKHLADAGSTVRFVLPGGEGGHDVGDVAPGGWDATVAYLKGIGVKSSKEAKLRRRR